MKQYIYFPIIILLVVFSFTSCSNEQDFIPNSPQFEKDTDENDRSPFEYLHTFSEIKDVKIEFIKEKDGLFIIINSVPERMMNLFITIGVEQKQNSQLIFLEFSETIKHFLPGIQSEEKLQIRIYGSLRKSASVPYPYSQTFDNITVKEWHVTQTSIFVSTSGFPSGLKHLYAELETRQGSYLVFLGRPEKPDFEIPKFGDLGVGDIKLFGYSGFTDG